VQLALKVDVAPAAIDPGEALKVQLGATGKVTDTVVTAEVPVPTAFTPATE
jgi:hypothetical protein